MAEVGGDTLPKNNAQYLRADYWDKRFASETAYEWLCAYADVRDLIVTKLRRGDRLLVLGLAYKPDVFVNRQLDYN